MSFNTNTEQCRICLENVRRYTDFREIILPDEEETIQKVLLSVGVDIISSSQDSITFLCLGCAKCLRFTHDFIRQAIDSQTILSPTVIKVKTESPIEIHTFFEANNEFKENFLIERQIAEEPDHENCFPATRIKVEDVDEEFSDLFSTQNNEITDYEKEFTDRIKDEDSDDDSVCSDDSNSEDYYEMESNTESEESTRQSQKKKMIKNLQNNSLQSIKTPDQNNIEELALVCTKCNQNFETKKSFQEHLLCLHRNDQDFICNVCQNQFSKRENFIEHLRKVHIGKKFSCNLCEKSFYRQSLLTDHLRSHTNEKPFECKQCSKTFSSKNNLKVHNNAIHSNTKFTYKCKYCEEAFKRYKSFKNHEKSIHFDASYKCPGCVKGFSDGYYLKVHFKRVHGSDITQEQLKVVRDNYKKKLAMSKLKLQELGRNKEVS